MQVAATMLLVTSLILAARPLDDVGVSHFLLDDGEVVGSLRMVFLADAPDPAPLVERLRSIDRQLRHLTQSPQRANVRSGSTWWTKYSTRDAIHFSFEK